MMVHDVHTPLDEERLEFLDERPTRERDGKLHSGDVEPRPDREIDGAARPSHIRDKQSLMTLLAQRGLLFEDRALCSAHIVKVEIADDSYYPFRRHAPSLGNDTLVIFVQAGA